LSTGGEGEGSLGAFVEVAEDAVVRIVDEVEVVLVAAVV